MRRKGMKEREIRKRGEGEQAKRGRRKWRERRMEREEVRRGGSSEERKEERQGRKLKGR